MRPDGNLGDCFSSFAWLIHQEAEKYINEHEAEYQEWAQAHAATDSTAEVQRIGKTRKIRALKRALDIDRQ